MSTSKTSQDQIEMRTCTVCGLARPLEEFRTRNGQHLKRCVDCRSPEYQDAQALIQEDVIDATQPRFSRNPRVINEEALAQVVDLAREVLEEVDETGLIPTDKLEQVYLSRPGARGTPQTALSATDAQFQKWILKAIGGLGTSTRLRYRLVMLAVVEELAAITDNHWRE